MDTHQESSPPSESTPPLLINNNSLGLYMYQTSIVLENLDKNINLLSQNVQELSKYNFQSYHNLKSEHDSLSRENKKLKRKHNELEYELQGYQDWEQQNQKDPPKNEKKYTFRRNKDSYSQEKINDIKSSLHDIQDVIRLKDQFRQIRHDGDLVRLYYCIESLKDLQNMIGMREVKDQIFKHLIYYIKNRKNEHMLHTVITGPPGTGKTELGNILGKIYLAVGALKNDVFRVVKRSDLIAGYLGQTAIKTQKVIDQCTGGVLFIDEAYSLGNSEQRDSFSKECLDTLNQNLTEKKENFMCIIAGYPKELEKCFFAYNPGLERRFSFKYNVEKYNSQELSLICRKKMDEYKLTLDISDSKLDLFFEKNYDKFTFFGGDVEKLILHSKLEASLRCFSSSQEMTMILDDLQLGIVNLKNKELEEEKEHQKYLKKMMYL
jgi:SpoVK/Ycf46/Vps4 family AAA+-type ATPase